MKTYVLLSCLTVRHRKIGREGDLKYYNTHTKFRASPRRSACASTHITPRDGRV